MARERGKLLRPVGSVVLISVAAGVAAGLAEAVFLAFGQPGGRPSGIGYSWLAQVIGLSLRVDLLPWLPATFRRYHEFTGAGAGWWFAGAAVLLNLLFSLAVGVAVSLPAALLASRDGGRRALFEGRPRLLLAAWLVFLSPVVLHLVSENAVPGLWRADSSGAAWAGVAMLPLFWLLLLWPVSRWPGFWAASRRAAAGLLALGAAVMAAGLVAGSGNPERVSPPAPDRPNILLISIDSLRADHLHCYGYARETSPHLDALAGEGAMFRWAIAPTSWTLPSHVTLLTSLPPHQHQVTGDFTRLRREAVTLAEALRDNGYQTAAFVSGLYLQADYGFQQGFDLYDDYTAMPAPWEAHRKVTSPGLLRSAIAWLEERSRDGGDRPFFLFLHLWDVHYDYAPPSPYDTMFDPDYDGTVTGQDFEASADIHPRMDPRDLEHVIALYDGEIRYTDEHLGRLFGLLRERGTLDDTVVAVTSDHGDEFFEHGKKGHRNSLYDEVIAVPLILRYPERIPAGRVVSEQARLLDVAPTLLALAGVEPPGEFGMTAGNPREFGRDVTSLITGPGAEEAPPAYGVLSWFLASVRTNSWKLIARVDGDPRPELYDLRSDPGERVNLSEEEPARLDALHQRLTRFREAMPARVLARSMEVDRGHLEALRSLGYITSVVDDALHGSVDMLTPRPDARIEDSTVTFRWRPVEEAKQYYLKVGSTTDAEDIYGRDQGTKTSARVSGIPLDGREIHVRLFWRTGSKWRHEDFVYAGGQRESAPLPCEGAAVLTNLSREGTAAFQVGDHYRVEVTGAAGQPVAVEAVHEGRRSVGHGFGSTDADGRLAIEGVMRSDAVGRWRQRWMVGGRCVVSTLEFEVLPAPGQ